MVNNNNKRVLGPWIDQKSPGLFEPVVKEVMTFTIFLFLALLGILFLCKFLVEHFCGIIISLDQWLRRRNV